MNKIKKILSIIMVICLIITYMSNLNISVKAAGLENVNLYVYSVNDEKLTSDVVIKWTLLAAQNDVIIKYHNPTDNSEVSIPVVQSTNTYTLLGLKKDFMYDLLIEVYDTNSDQIGVGFIYYTPRITYTSTLVEQTRTAILGGGYKIGDIPRLKIDMTIPKVFDGVSGTYQFVNSAAAISYINNRYLTYLGVSKDLNEIDFKLNISNDRDSLSSGSSISSIEIKSSGTTYTANVIGSNFSADVVDNIGVDGTISFEIVGRQDSSKVMTTASDLDLGAEFLSSHNIVPHDGIYSGTVYYFGLKYDFKTTTDTSVYIGAAGITTDLNNMLLYGINEYTYTSPYFELSKDDSDNVYMKLKDIEVGGLDIGDITYEIQVNDDKTIPGDWTIKKEINRTFFSETTNEAIIILTDIGSSNKLYYKVVVKSGNDTFRIDSYPLEYTISEDISRPPVPRNIQILNRKLVSREVTVDSITEVQNSSDITIYWDKPANWDDIVNNTDSDEDIVFHLLLNTYQRDEDIDPYPSLIAEGENYGDFEPKFRKTMYISARDSRITVNDTTLQLTIKGFELFQNSSYMSGYDGVLNQPEITNVDISSTNTDNYPGYLLPNTIYYLKMYTTKGLNKNTTDSNLMSEFSILKSFTTKGVGVYDVPLPKLFRLKDNYHETYIEDDEVKLTNYVELQFDKVDINWEFYTSDISVHKEVYYDVYMSNRPEMNSFKFVGTTENLEGDVLFIGASDVKSSSIISKVSRFTQGTEAYLTFGKKLKENSKYYFIVKTRLEYEGQTDLKESSFTSVLPVTTVRINIEEPNPNNIRPLALDDFAIATNSDGTQQLGGNKVSFEWDKKEEGVIYNIVATSDYVEPNKDIELLKADPIYLSYVSTFGEVYVDPTDSPMPAELDFDVVSNKFNYTVDKWLVPNKLYYFSIRAVDKVNSNIFSNWISIPVTTKIIESPEVLKVIRTPEIGFNWIDTDVLAQPINYKVYKKKSLSNDSYQILISSNYSLYKEDSTYFLRIFNLDYDEKYDFKVVKNDGVNAYKEVLNKKTVNNKNEIEVKWKGLSNYNYEIALRAPEDSSYRKITTENLEQYDNYDSIIRPQYIEKSEDLYGTQYSYYYAKIKTVPIVKEEGLVNDPLKSNTKYFIKVRTVNVDPLNSSIITYSKYIGPVETRTDFDPEDTDRELLIIERETAFRNEMKKLEKRLFWDFSKNGSTQTDILLKGDIITNYMSLHIDNEIVIDISGICLEYGKNNIYIPSSVIDTLNTNSKILKIRTKNSDFIINTNSLVIEENKSVLDLKKKSTVKDIYYLVSISQDIKSKRTVQDNLTPVSSFIDLDVLVMGHSMLERSVYNSIETLINDKESGLISEAISKIKFSTVLPSVETLYNDANLQIKSYIRNIYSKSYFNSEIIKISNFFNNSQIKFDITDFQGLKYPYIITSDDNQWQEMFTEFKFSKESVMLDIDRTGYFMIASVNNISGVDINDIIKDSSYAKLTEKYNVWQALSTEKLSDLEQEISVEDSIGIFEILVGVEPNRYLTLRERAQRLDLYKLITESSSVDTVEKQLLSLILVKLYAEKTGIDIQYLLPKSKIYIMDETAINVKLKKYVLLSIDLNLLDYEEGLFFRPTKKITINETIKNMFNTLDISREFD